MFGKLLLGEDRNFHSIQMIEGAFRQYSVLDSNGDNMGCCETHLDILQKLGVVLTKKFGRIYWLRLTLSYVR
jgi:hypothetical protein